MSADERIAERIKAVEMARKGVEYEEFKFPKKVLKITRSKGGKIIEVEAAKRHRIREALMPLPKREEGMRKNGEEIAKRQEKLAINKMKNSNRIITELHTKVPIIYYVIMAFGLASAIFGAFSVVSYPIYYSVVIGGIGVALVAFIGVLEIKYLKIKLKIIPVEWSRGY